MIHKKQIAAPHMLLFCMRERIISQQYNFSAHIGVELEYEAIEVLSTLNGWVLRGIYWYWYEGGRRATGWRRIRTGNSYFWYYLNGRVNNGRMATGWTDTGGQTYFLNPRLGIPGHITALPEGAMHSGWLGSGGLGQLLRLEISTLTICGKMGLIAVCKPGITPVLILPLALMQPATTMLQ